MLRCKKALRLDVAIRVLYLCSPITLCKNLFMTSGPNFKPLSQCDQTANLFFILCLFKIIKICPKAFKICQSTFNILPNTLKILPNTN